MEDHDQRIKTLLQEFVIEFLRLFFADIIHRLDLTRITWLSQEVFANPPSGARYRVDLLARIPLLPEPGEQQADAGEKFLVHVEIESADTVEPLRKRMFDYHVDLTRRLNADILPVAIYLRVGLQGRGLDAYVKPVLNRQPIKFEYDYVGLPGLSGAEYLRSGNCLGVAWSALMQWPSEERVQAALDAIEWIAASGENGWRKLLLVECIQAYAPLEDSQRLELTTLLDEPKRGIRTMIKTWAEEAEERGARSIVVRLLEKQFGPLPEPVMRRLAAYPTTQLAELAVDLLKGQSLRELGLEDEANGTAP